MSVKVTIVGCGSVGLSMGWYHASQIVGGRIKEMQVTDVVDPFMFGGAGEGSKASDEVRQWFRERAPEVCLHQSLKSVTVPHPHRIPCLRASRPVL
jgi:glycine/D-amino acid oxidase-like deaminating enzyme